MPLFECFDNLSDIFKWPFWTGSDYTKRSTSIRVYILKVILSRLLAMVKNCILGLKNIVYYTTQEVRQKKTKTKHIVSLRTINKQEKLKVS